MQQTTSRSTSQNPFLKLGFLTGLDMFANSTVFPGTSCSCFWRTNPHPLFLWKPAVHLIIGPDNVDVLGTM